MMQFVQIPILVDYRYCSLEQVENGGMDEMIAQLQDDCRRAAVYDKVNLKECIRVVATMIKWGPHCEVIETVHNELPDACQLEFHFHYEP